MTSDVRRLRQVLANLLSNAIKYNRGGGRVDARLGVQDGELRISVVDDGIGMTEQQKGQLFAPFNRLGKEGDARYEGTGLGLAITKQVVEALGGGSWWRVRRAVAASFSCSFRPGVTADSVADHTFGGRGRSAGPTKPDSKGIRQWRTFAGDSFDRPCRRPMADCANKSRGKRRDPI